MSDAQRDFDVVPEWTTYEMKLPLTYKVVPRRRQSNTAIWLALSFNLGVWLTLLACWLDGDFS